MSRCNLVFVSATQRIIIHKNIPREVADEKARRLTKLSPATVKYIVEEVGHGREKTG